MMLGSPAPGVLTLRLTVLFPEEKKRDKTKAEELLILG
jgi:hypothetical protein